MPLFEYQARSLTGEISHGQMQASSVATLTESLLERGLFLDRSARRWSVNWMRPWSGAWRLSVPQKIALVQQFHMLASSGLSVIEQVELLAKSHSSKSVSAGLSAVAQKLKDGQPLAVAAAEYPSVFDPQFRACLSVGEQTGNLEKPLNFFANHLDLKYQMSRQLWRAISYPMFLVALLLITLIALMVLVLPQFAALYKDFGTELPGATRLLMNISAAAPIWLPVIACVIISCVLAANYLIGTVRGGYALSCLARRVPIIGPVISANIQITLAFQLHMLLASGVSIRESLDLAAQTALRPYVAQMLQDARTGIEAGQPLSLLMAQTDLLDEISVGLIRGGENSGRLSDVFEKIGHISRYKLERALQGITSILEPALMLLVGGLMGATIISVYLPIFGISEVIR